MKIRADFVTNSSSASFILMLKEDIADSYLELYKKHAETGSAQLLSFVRDKLKNEGNTTRIDGIECYYAIKNFSLGKVLLLDQSLNPDQIATTDLSQLTDDQMWNLLNWIVVKGKSSDLNCLGATMIGLAPCNCEVDPRTIKC